MVLTRSQLKKALNIPQGNMDTRPTHLTTLQTSITQGTTIEKTRTSGNASRALTTNVTTNSSPNLNRMTVDSAIGLGTQNNNQTQPQMDRSTTTNSEMIDNLLSNRNTQINASTASGSASVQ